MFIQFIETLELFADRLTSAGQSLPDKPMTLRFLMDMDVEMVKSNIYLPYVELDDFSSHDLYIEPVAYFFLCTSEILCMTTKHHNR